MKISTLAVAVVLLCIILPITGCRTAPVNNLENIAISGSSKNLTMGKVESAIKKACHYHGWTTKKIKPGLIEATLLIRSHKAVVNIPFNTKRYSINYKSSTNLDYDGKNIHSQYYVWVRNLRKRIDFEIENME